MRGLSVFVSGTLLVLVLVAWPTGVASTADPFPIILATDASNDAVRPAGAPLDPNQPFAGLDVLGIDMLGEDQRFLSIGIRLANFRVGKETDTTTAFYVMDGHLGFTLPGTNFTYRIFHSFFWHAEAGNIASAPVIVSPIQSTWLSVFQEGRPIQGGGAVRVTWDDEANTIGYRIPKYALAGGEGPAKGTFALTKGTVFGDFRVVNVVDQIGPMGSSSQTELVASDEAPDPGERSAEYPLRFQPASTTLLVQIASGNETLPLRAGANQSIPFRIGNLASEKRLIQLAYRLDGPDGQLPGFQAFGPSTLALPPMEWRNYSLFVKTPDTLPEADVHITLEALAPESEDLGLASAQLVRGFALTPERNKLFLHEYSFPDSAFTAGYNTLCRTSTMSCAPSLFLSEQRSDPRDSEQNEVMMEYSEQPVARAATPETLVAPIVLDETQRANLRLRLRSENMDIGELEIAAELAYTVGDMTYVVAGGSGSHAIKTAPENVEIPLVILLDSPAVVPAFGTFELRLTFTPPASIHSSVRMQGSPLWLDIDQSSIELPALPLPPELQDTAAASPFHTSLLGEREEFINPGAARLFNLTVTNIDGREQRLRLEVTSSLSGWPIEMLPGRTFVLPSAESVRVGVLVRAPADAPEAARAIIHVKALADDLSSQDEVLYLKVTTGAILPDDTNAFVADDDAVNRLVATTKGTPGPPAAMALAMLVALGGVLRRARRCLWGT